MLFVTEAERDATSADIADYDAFVTAQVAASPLAQLNTTWVCFGSTPTVAARDHAVFAFADTPVYRPDGVLIAADYNQLINTSSGTSLSATQSITENGNPAAARAWTGTWPNGTIHPGSLGNTGTTAKAGAPAYTTYSWMFGNDLPVTQSLPLYGISAVLTVPIPPASIQIPLNYNFNGMFTSAKPTTPTTRTASAPSRIARCCSTPACQPTRS
ncbi:MAG: hypothetical protein AB8H80_19530 [Planctomycetota bacterium]